MTFPEAMKPERRDWLPILTFTVMIFLQSATAIWWASSLDRRIGEAEKDATSLASQVDFLQQSQAQGATFMGRIDERLTAQGASLARIERLLEERDK